MKNLIFGAAAVALMTSGALAQTGNPGPHNPAIKNSTVGHVAAPANGRNSFTEAQARGRIAKAGYSGISKLVRTGTASGAVRQCVTASACMSGSTTRAISPSADFTSPGEIS